MFGWLRKLWCHDKPDSDSDADDAYWAERDAASQAEHDRLNEERWASVKDDWTPSADIYGKSQDSPDSPADLGTICDRYPDRW